MRDEIGVRHVSGEVVFLESEMRRAKAQAVKALVVEPV